MEIVLDQCSMDTLSPVICPVKAHQIRSIKYPRKHLLLLGIFFSIFSCQRPVLELDYLIQGALVFNGENQEPAYRDVGVLGDQIVLVGDASRFTITTERTIDATGLYLSPGFIDPKEFREISTFESPYEEAVGMKYVFVNGQLVIDSGEFMGILPGRALRHFETDSK